MIASGTGLHIPEVVTGLIGVAFIAWAVIASIQYANVNKNRLKLIFSKVR